MRRSLNVRSAMRLGMFVSALVGLPVATSLAAITVDPVANDVSPTNPATWTSSTQAYVGNTDDGKLTVDGGSQISNGYESYLGHNSGSTGITTITGKGSKWMSAAFYVGNSGTGTLKIENGGIVSSGWSYVVYSGSTLIGSGTGYSYLGYNSGSTGTVTVTGAGSKWSSDYSLYVGCSGTGTLTIENGGTVISSGYSPLGYNSGSTGTATVTGIGSKWINDRSIDVGYSGTGTLNIENGGTVISGTSSSESSLGFDSGSTGMATVTGTGSKWVNSGGLYLGYHGNGTLIIENGGTVTSSYAYFGFNSGSTGRVTITGAGSNWTSGWLDIGQGGMGTLNIENGGEVTSSYAYLGKNSSLMSTANVTGPGSKWTTSSLYVGDSGHGMLNIENGGTVTTSGSAYLGCNTGSTGTVTVTGIGSKWITNSLNVGSSGAVGTLNVSNSGTVTCSSSYDVSWLGDHSAAIVTGSGSKWTNSGLLHINGTLIIENGGEVTSSSSYLGYSGSTGTVTVTGTGSKWTNSGSLYVGYNGTVSLTVADGGQVSAVSLYASLSDLRGNGTINVTRGAVLDADWVFDSTRGLTQTLAFGSGGTLKLTVDSSSVLGAGYKNTGSLRIADGQGISSTSGYLGYGSGSTGTATVTGSGSKWTNSSSLYVGYNGTGTLNIENGGEVSSTSSYYSYVGYGSHSSGAVKVTGSGSKWTTTDSLYVGYNGTGTLNIENSSIVTSSSSSYIGYNSASTGTTTVTGSGSKWTNNSGLYVGYSGTGTLDIENGGTVTSSYSYLGYNSGSTGTATVTGSGSKWTHRSSLYVGRNGSGKLNIHRGGLVTAQSVSINSISLLSLDIGFDSTLNINNGTGTLTNNGKVRFTASANVAAGEYQPILAGTFAGSGIYQAFGGRWDNTRHVFIVDAAETGSIDNSINLDLTVSRRAAITDATSGQTLVGASFLSGSGIISFAADELTSSEESALSLMLTAGSDLLAGYQFTVTGTTISSTNPVYLSLFVGQDYDEDTFKLWHYDGTAWTVFLPTDLSYDGLFASFTVTGFSGYAISGELIPEPASLGLLALSSMVLLMRRRS